MKMTTEWSVIIGRKMSPTALYVFGSICDSREIAQRSVEPTGKPTSASELSAVTGTIGF